MRGGLQHISDDDFARAVIAEQFAHAPRLDPSGTSWLPFPFWVTGGAMMVFGRWLAVARAVAFGLNGAGAALVLAALRRAGVDRVTALAGAVLAMATPWNACLGAAAVPEGFTGAFVAAATIAAGSGRGSTRAWMNVALLCASLSRYEVWPACLLVTVWELARLRAMRVKASASEEWVPWKAIVVALIPMLGPAAWMAWNLHAHGSATHFLARVAAYRH
ncbi:MAG TPA: hypothetical protein VNO21_05610, partial [Polyangiaceae bacterium]|nr:hypothetical protein [Polyangiaceae bacterium]